MKWIDLSSDTATQPSQKMREAIANAQVGDEQRGEDPTVLELEAQVIKLLNKEAALFLPSATQANQIAIKLHTEPGDEVLADSRAHIIESEAGAPAFISGVMITGITTPDGIFRTEDLEATDRGSHPRFPRRKLICVENTHNRAGGQTWPLEAIASVASYARMHQLGLHLDGARIFNAEAASGHPVHRLVEHFKTITICFSKGLGAPGGAMLVLPRDWIDRGLRLKRILGGAMRQSGILAAGCLYGLTHHRSLLSEDHRRAKDLAQFFSEQKCFEVRENQVVTNLILLNLKPKISWSMEDLNEMLQKKGVRILPLGPRQARVMTHLDIDDQSLEKTKRVFHEVLRELR